MGSYKINFDGGYALLHMSDIVKVALDCAGRERTTEEVEFGVGEFVFNQSHVYMSVGNAYCGPDVYFDKDCTRWFENWYEYINVCDSVNFEFAKLTREYSQHPKLK
jgi:hypothetical protein